MLVDTAESWHVYIMMCTEQSNSLVAMVMVSSVRPGCNLLWTPLSLCILFDSLKKPHIIRLFSLKASSLTTYYVGS